jgi:hypothetical protein
MALDPASSGTMAPCEWCKKTDRLTPIRDWEEHGGFAPHVYEVCPRCVEKHRQGFEAASAEWAAYIEPRYTASSSEEEVPWISSS